MEIELHLEQLAVDLDLAARAARSRMQKGDGKTLSTFSDKVQHRRWLHGLLSEMTSVVDRTAKKNGAVSTDSRLYVWPGYDSVWLDGSRVTFDVDRDVRKALSRYGYPSGITGDEPADAANEREMQTGMLFPPSKSTTDRATLYFDAALASLPARSADGESTFSVGGTHNWLALNPMIGSEPLMGFEVRTEGAAHNVNRSFPAILLDPNRPLVWGDDLAEAIRSACGDTAQSFWPLPVRRRGESGAAYRERLAMEHVSVRNRSIRQRLYSLWLIGCFLPNAAELLLGGKGQRWIDRLIADLETVEPERADRVRGLCELERNFASGADLPLNRARFTKWGVLTIPYPIADSKIGEEGEESDDLGSGMLLSNFDVPPWYYLSIRQWIASYYLSLRQQESSALRAEREAHKAALHAERELRRQLSHAIGTELTYVQFLATVAADSIAPEQFKVSSAKMAAAISRHDTHSVPDRFDTEFVERHGRLTAVESKLVTIIADNPHDPGVLRDVSLIEASFAAIPHDDARNVMAALISEVRRATLENRALVRVDDAAVFAKLERRSDATQDLNAAKLIDLLRHALVAAVTVFFRKAFPPYLEGPEEVCLRAAEALFGASDMDSETRRRLARATAIDWRSFVAREYKASSEAPPYAVIRSWLTNDLPKRARLRMDLPDCGDIARLAPGCGDHAPLVVQAWLTEALMNALKHSRPPAADANAVIRVGWLSDDAILKVSNTTTPENAAEVSAAVEAAASGAGSRKDGHQGLAFLSYAARHLFRANHLNSHFDNGHMLHLLVR